MTNRSWNCALEIARHGEGLVEPNPQVGAVVVKDGQIVGEGWHQKFGGPHAERHALAAAGPRARGATLYVTLEPCCHAGKTPPCTDAVIEAGIARTVVAVSDPFPQVCGGGIDRLRSAGIECEVGLREQEARARLAVSEACHHGATMGHRQVGHDARWKDRNAHRLEPVDHRRCARDLAHQVRGRMDAIVVGGGTVRTDDPLLTARPAGPRTATRIALGDVGRESRLASTAGEAPLMVCALPRAAARRVRLAHPCRGRVSADRARRPHLAD